MDELLEEEELLEDIWPTERGLPTTTGAQEETTVDELQLRFVGGGGVVGGPLTLRGRMLSGDAR